MAQPIFFWRISDIHCDRIHSFLTAVRCFDKSYVGKQPVARKEYYWLKEFQESMDRCIGHCDITEIHLKTALNIIQSINHFLNKAFNPSLNAALFLCVCSRILLETLWEKENLLLMNNFSFSTHLENFLSFSSNMNLSSANSFSLEVLNLLCRKGLTPSQTTNFRFSQTERVFRRQF